MDNISIIIRNRNEGEFIGFALQSCLDFFDKPEIIIINNKSTDDSLEVVNLFSDRTDIKICDISHYTPGKSINLGAKKATRDTILVLSAPSPITDLFNNQQQINMFSEIEDRYFLHNAFCFYNTQFLQNNPMPETYPGKEDRYWAIDMVDKGYKYLYDPSLSVNHYYTKNGATWKGIG